MIREWPRSLRTRVAGAAAALALIATACGGAAAPPEAASNAVPAPTPPPLVFAAPTATPAPVAHFDTEFTEPFAVLNPVNRDRPVDMQEYIRSTEPDAIAPVYTPEYLSADNAQLDPDELVMGLEINGEARAFPVGLMRNREMVNDVIGGVPVLVSW